MEKQKMFKISQEERQKLLAYMQNRPYAEVYMLIAMIVGLRPMDTNGEAKDKDKPKKVVM